MIEPKTLDDITEQFTNDYFRKHGLYDSGYGLIEEEDVREWLLENKEFILQFYQDMEGK